MLLYWLFVTALTFMYLQEELWIEISTGKNRRWLLTHLYVEIWHQVCQALPF